MEADNYLATGYGLRLALCARLVNGRSLGDLADIWQPSRLKGIQVGANYGTPFLAATQVFDLRPVPRKFLSLNRTEDSSARFVTPGQILVTCSGSVGRATLATDALSGILVSHDLLRIEARDQKYWGWIYAYLRSGLVRSMMGAAQYGHIIKHLEPSHLQSLPMPMPRGEIARDAAKSVSQILAARNRAVLLWQEAESLYESAVKLPKKLNFGEAGFVVPASSLISGRRRLEGAFHNPVIGVLRKHFSAQKLPTKTLRESGFDLWLPTRFRRIPAQEGIELIGSADLFEMNPDLEKRIADGDFGDRNSGRVQRGWLLLARSGQIYGLNGTLAIANAFHEGKVISDHVIRIAPAANCDMRTGYAYTALSHPILGRPMVKSLAYGSSIPEIDVGDAARLHIPRLTKAIEDKIADKAEEGAALFAEADILENRLSGQIDALLKQLIAGSWEHFVPFGEVGA